MENKELAKLISDRIKLVGTYFEYIKTIENFSEKEKYFEEIFFPLLLSLQNSIYIELYKIVVKNNKDGKYSINALIEQCESKDKNKYEKKISKFKKDNFESIRERRNKVFAHETNQDGQLIFNKNEITDLEKMLKCFIEICVEINPKIIKSIHYDNANKFKRWLSMNEKVNR